MAREIEVTQGQIEALGEKLDKFAQGLGKEERDVLGWVLHRASETSNPEELSEKELENVSGGGRLASGAALGYRNQISNQLGQSLGQKRPGVGSDPLEFRISWSW